jgi:alpha-L-fucosidase
MKFFKTCSQSSLILLLAIFFYTNTSAQHNEYYPDPNPVIQKKLEEWQDLKFGLLMHWGTYSLWGIVESWSICPEDLSWATGGRKKGVADSYNEYVKKYTNLKTTFNPSKFNPEKWAEAAKEAGMKYMIFTTKHHDGFCMFDSKYTDYKITDKDCPFSTNPRANVTKEIFDAFRKENLWVGAYFSKPDWHSDYYWWKKFPPSDRNANYSIQKHPDQWKKFVDFTHNQINELMSNYGKVDILWLDGGWVRKKTDEEVKEALLDTSEGSRWARNPQSQDINMPALVKEVRSKQPDLIVVDRAVPGEYQNYLTPEQHIPATGLPYPWETCMTMGNSWSYVPGDVYKSADVLINTLVDIVSKGGNYLLNIGPGPDGEWDPVAYERLKEIGAWMKINSEAIYATRMYNVYGESGQIHFNQSKDKKTKFIFLSGFPDSGKVLITKMPFEKNTNVTMLGASKNLKWKNTSAGIEINVPSTLKKASNYVWVLKVVEK